MSYFFSHLSMYTTDRNRVMHRLVLATKTKPWLTFSNQASCWAIGVPGFVLDLSLFSIMCGSHICHTRACHFGLSTAHTCVHPEHSEHCSHSVQDHRSTAKPPAACTGPYIIALSLDHRGRATMARPVPNAFICPITQDVMDVPVCAPDGRSYEQVRVQSHALHQFTCTTGAHILL